MLEHQESEQQPLSDEELEACVALLKDHAPTMDFIRSWQSNGEACIIIAEYLMDNHNFAVRASKEFKNLSDEDQAAMAVFTKYLPTQVSRDNITEFAMFAKTAQQLLASVT